MLTVLDFVLTYLYCHCISTVQITVQISTVQIRPTENNDSFVKIKPLKVCALLCKVQ